MINGAPLGRTWIWLRAHEGAAAALVYALVLTIAYHNVVFLGESLVSSNNLNMLEYRITARTHGPNFRPASDWNSRNLLLMANLHDIGGAVVQWEPAAIFLRHSLAHGEMPFWDPYVGGGAPSMSNMTTSFFFPPYFLLVVLGNGVLLKNLYILALLLTGGWFTWALLRRSALSWPASFVGGLTFMLCGALTQTVGSILSQPASAFLWPCSRRVGFSNARRGKPSSWSQWYSSDRAGQLPSRALHHLWVERRVHAHRDRIRR